MKHQITTTLTNGDWELKMRCEFADETIAELIMRTASIAPHRSQCLQHEGNAIARIEQDGNTITLTSYDKQGSYAYKFGSREETKSALEAIAQQWEAKEQIYLPAMQYFEARTKDVMKQWSANQNDKLNDLEAEIENERLKREGDIRFCEGQITKLLEKAEALEKLYDGLHQLISTHKKPFWKR